MASDDGSIAAFLGLSLPPSIQRWSLAEVISFIEAKRNPSLRKYLRRHLGKIRDRAGSSSSSEGDPKLLSTLTGSAATSKLVRALHKLVLSTFIAARPELQKASRQSLKALGLKGPHEWGATFELAAFDVLIDEAYNPWLLEVNTSPSLKQEESEEGAAGGSHHQSGDLPVKLRVLSDMLTLSDAIPDQEDVSPEAALKKLYEANILGEGCSRKWRLDGCKHCPRWDQIASLMRTASEERRAGGFVPLVPSQDAEWSAIAKPKDTEEPMSLHSLVDSWVHADAAPGAKKSHTPPCADAACVERRWQALTCDT